MVLERVTESVLAHTGGETRGNVAFVNLEEFIVAIDSGMFPPIIKDFRERVEDIWGKKVKYLIITHYHGDHVFGNQIFEDCTIVSSKKTLDLMRARMSTDWSPDKLEEFIRANPEYAEKLRGLRIVLPNKVFEGEFLLESGGKILRVVETGGHCDGSAYVYFPSEKVLIAGDLYFADMWPYGGDPTVDPYKWIDALREMVSLDIEKVVPGHGPIKSKSDLEKHLEFMENIVNILEDFAKQGKSLEDVLESDEVADLEKFVKDEAGLMKPTIMGFYEKIRSRFKQ